MYLVLAEVRSVSPTNLAKLKVLEALLYWRIIPGELCGKKKAQQDRIAVITEGA